MLKVDIGLPKTSLTSLTSLPHREFMTYQTTTKVPLSGYTVIGNSTSTRLFHPELSPEGYLNVTPSFIYYLQTDPAPRYIATTPLSCVLAREYTKGLVIFRTNVYGGSDVYDGSVNFLQTNVTVQLPPTPGFFYRRVYYNGSLSGPVSSVTIGGYEGIVFVSEPAPPTSSLTPTVQPSVLPTVASDLFLSQQPTKYATLASTLSPSVANSRSPSQIQQSSLSVTALPSSNLVASHSPSIYPSTSSKLSPTSSNSPTFASTSMNVSHSARRQVFPSTATSWCIPGYWQKPTGIILVQVN